MDRRQFGKFLFAGLGATAAYTLLPIRAAFAETVAKLTTSDAEWKQRLTPEQYRILREEGTEHPFTSANNDEHRKGMFACIACDLPLFNSDAKFDSHTGWPSFFAAIPDHVETRRDFSLLMARTEYHCARCGGHHGHLFTDGPQPTGLRYCSNGAVLKFVAAVA